MIKNKGQITIPITLALSIGSIAIAWLGSFYTSQITTNEKIANVSSEVKVVETRTNNLESRLDRMEDKIDLLLQKNGVKYIGQ